MPSVSSIEEASGFLADAFEQERRVRLGDDLTTEGLDRILEHDPGDLTCTVESGVRLSTLRDELARSGQRLSLDPPGDPTIGALLATNVSGPLRHRFGAPRDLVLGVTLVLADGTIASSGGKVVKNVAGYDLARLVCGSRGRLALIGRASFRLHPLPRATATLVVETDDAAAVVARLLRSQLQPSALDVLHPGRVVVLFEGSARGCRGAGGRQRARRPWSGSIEDPFGLGRVDEATSARRRADLRFAPGELDDVLADLDDGDRPPGRRCRVHVVRDDPSYNLLQGPTRALAVGSSSASDSELDPRGVLA